MTQCRVPRYLIYLPSTEHTPDSVGPHLSRDRSTGRMVPLPLHAQSSSAGRGTRALLDFHCRKGAVTNRPVPSDCSLVSPLLPILSKSARTGALRRASRRRYLLQSVLGHIIYMSRFLLPSEAVAVKGSSLDVLQTLTVRAAADQGGIAILGLPGQPDSSPAGVQRPPSPAGAAGFPSGLRSDPTLHQMATFKRSLTGVRVQSPYETYR